MYRSGLVILFLSGASWALVGLIAGDWQLAGYTLVSVLVFGYVLLLSAFRKKPVVVVKPVDTDELAKALRAAQVKTQELEALKAQFLSGVSNDIAKPLVEIQKSAALLLDGTYGKLPPAAEEAVRQITERASAVAGSTKGYLHAENAVASPPAEKGITSIKKLKVG